MRLLAALALLLTMQVSMAQKPLDYYLPKNVTYNKNIPTPEAILGYEVGKWHVSHDQLVYYMRMVANASDRITLEVTGKTHEDRPLLLLTISSPENQKVMKRLQAAHAQLSDPNKSSELDVSNLPVVVYQGYSVHGNESSGSNAAVVLAYYLAAAQGPAVDSLLNETIVLLDPCLNPDGLNRFASWVNTHRSKTPSGDGNTREHNEAWPRGRTNHYWFDLNRDWLPVQHPESQARIAQFHQWKPNVLTDHHEMGGNSTYFFQPGIPARTNPNTPRTNQELTGKIATYHAAALDRIGSLYYTKESFDDYYYGKGSTYPDVNGCVGILFEQASSRGHLQHTENGKLPFAFTIRNQFVTSLSTLQAARELREELLNYQRDFYADAIKAANGDPVAAYALNDNHDPSRVNHLVEVLLQHNIQVKRPKQDVKAGNQVLLKDHTYLVELQQPQYHLIKAMFERRTEFLDSLFYDVSAWTLDRAFNVALHPISKKAYRNNHEVVTSVPAKQGRLIGGTSKIGYLFNWNPYEAPRVLNAILKKGLIAKVATKPVSNKAVPSNYLNEHPTFALGRGSIFIPAQNQPVSSSKLGGYLQKLAAREGIDIFGVSTGLSNENEAQVGSEAHKATGLTDGFADLGSSSFRKVKRQKIMLLAGNGVRSYDAGEIWHLLDHRFDIDVAVVDINTFNYAKLHKYTTIIMADGSYGGINSSGLSKLKTWLNDGGNLVAIKGAVQWLKGKGLAHVEYKKADKDTSSAPKAYANLGNNYGAQVIGGAIVNTSADLTHPLLYGYHHKELPFFRRGTSFMKPAKNNYATPIRYTSNPLVSGYISDKNIEQLKSSATVVVSGQGRGRVTCFADNPNFRAFWYGTNKVFLNALFFGNLVEGGAVAAPLKKEDKKTQQEEEHQH